MLNIFAILIMILTVAAILWSLFQGQFENALYQFFLGSAVALLLRRTHEVRLGERKKELEEAATAANTASKSQS